MATCNTESSTEHQEVIILVTTQNTPPIVIYILVIHMVSLTYGDGPSNGLVGQSG